MKIFISGGCKNGKSTFAEKITVSLNKKDIPLYYIATMISADTEDDLRIQRHIKSREHYNFKTVEIGKNINEITDKCDNQGTFLVDSLTALLANEMFLPNGEVNLDASKKVSKDLMKVFQKIEDIVFVSDYIYSDANIYDKYTEAYKKSLASIDALCAKNCDVVVEVCYGNLTFHKGGNLIAELI